jgi:hypothetical protein
VEGIVRKTASYMNNSFPQLAVFMGTQIQEMFVITNVTAAFF